MRLRARNPWVLLVLLLTGAVIGGFLGQYLSQYFPFLQYNYPIGIREPFFLDLGFLSIIFGFVVNINVAGMIGLIVAVLVFFRI